MSDSGTPLMAAENTTMAKPVWSQIRITISQKMLIGLVVSQENSCRFCYAVVRSTLWLQGMDAERIRRVIAKLAQCGDQVIEQRIVLGAGLHDALGFTPAKIDADIPFQVGGQAVGAGA